MQQLCQDVCFVHHPALLWGAASLLLSVHIRHLIAMLKPNLPVTKLLGTLTYVEPMWKSWWKPTSPWWKKRPILMDLSLLTTLTPTRKLIWTKNSIQWRNMNKKWPFASISITPKNWYTIQCSSQCEWLFHHHEQTGEMLHVVSIEQNTFYHAKYNKFPFKKDLFKTFFKVRPISIKPSLKNRCTIHSNCTV